MKRAAFLVVVLGLFGSSWSQGEELSALQIKDARKLYLSKCAKCHKLYDPTKYTDEKWSEWMSKMTKKSKLSPEQSEVLTRYVAAGKAGHLSLRK